MAPGNEPDDSPIVEPPPVSADDITFPEEVVVSDELRDEFLGLLNDKEKSPKERAQALIDLQVKAAQAASEASSQAWADMQTEWQNAVKADPEIGGEKLQPTLGRIRTLLNEYGSPELDGVFNTTGAGNNIEVIRFLDRVAKKLTEGGPALAAAPTNAQPTAAQRLFPSMKG